MQKRIELTQRLEQYQAVVQDLDPAGVVSWAVQTFGAERIALASSLGPEDQALTAMLVCTTKKPRVFTLDTGRLYQETYSLMQQTMRTYGLRYQVYGPEAQDVAELLERDGPNGMFETVAKRQACCEVRKVRPLRRALSGLDAWITGLRRDQGPTREQVQRVSWDEEHGLFKICPLVDWSEDDVWRYLRTEDVPYNALHRRGFRSIGCAPCTRATSPAEDSRAGRWWWERAEQRECGLHRKVG